MRFLNRTSRPALLLEVPTRESSNSPRVWVRALKRTVSENLRKERTPDASPEIAASEKRESGESFQPTISDAVMSISDRLMILNLNVLRRTNSSRSDRSSNISPKCAVSGTFQLSASDGVSDSSNLDTMTLDTMSDTSSSHNEVFHDRLNIADLEAVSDTSPSKLTPDISSEVDANETRESGKKTSRPLTPKEVQILFDWLNTLDYRELRLSTNDMQVVRNMMDSNRVSVDMDVGDTETSEKRESGKTSQALTPDEVQDLFDWLGTREHGELRLDMDDMQVLQKMMDSDSAIRRCPRRCFTMTSHVSYGGR